MDNIIENARILSDMLRDEWERPAAANRCADAVRRLEECRALLRRLADDEPAPEGHSYQSWAKELLA